MARHLRVEYPEAIYHVACRMIEDSRLDQSRLFTEDRERVRFLESMAERAEQYNVRLYLFVLMTNHFHLVFETPESNCSKFMHSLLTAHTVYYNLRHGRHGHLFDGRFKAKLVQGDDYLLALTRYVHLNPVMAGRMKDRPLKEKIEHLRGYMWSSYPGYIGRSKPLGYVEYGPVLAEMGGKRRERPGRYRRYVEAGLASNDEEFKAALKLSPRSIGGEGFRAWVDELYQNLMEKRSGLEDISFRKVTEPLASDSILKIVAKEFGVSEAELKERRRNSVLKAVGARMLSRFGALTQREVAKELGVGTGGAVSAQVRRLPALLAGDRRLRKTVEGIEKRLVELKHEKARSFRQRK